MALSLLAKAKQYFTSKSQDNEGWLRQGKFTPLQQIGEGINNWQAKPSNQGFNATKQVLKVAAQNTLSGLPNLFRNASNDPQNIAHYIPGGKTLTQTVANRVYQPISDLPSNLHTIFDKSQPALTRGGAALSTAFTPLNYVPSAAAFTYVGMPALDYVKSRLASEKRGENFAQQQKSGFEGFSGQKVAGLGEAISTNPTVQTIGNLAELPVIMFATHKANKIRAGMQDFKNAEGQIATFVNKVKLYDKLRSAETQMSAYDDAYNLGKKLIPGIIKTKEMRDLGNRNPKLWLQTISQYLQDSLMKAKNPEFNVGFTIKRIGKIPEETLKKYPVIESSPIKTGGVSPLSPESVSKTQNITAEEKAFAKYPNLAKPTEQIKTGGFITTDGKLIEVNDHTQSLTNLGFKEGSQGKENLTNYMNKGGIRTVVEKNGIIDLEIHKTPTENQLKAIQSLPEGNYVFDLFNGNTRNSGMTDKQGLLQKLNETYLKNLSPESVSPIKTGEVKQPTLKIEYGNEVNSRLKDALEVYRKTGDRETAKNNFFSSLEDDGIYYAEKAGQFNNKIDTAIDKYFPKQPTIKIKADSDQNLLNNQQGRLDMGKPSVSSSQESGLQAPQSTLPKIKIKVGQPNQISSGKPPSEPIIPQIKLSDIEKKIYGSETKLGNTGNKISVGPIGDKIRIVENKANEIIAKGLTAKNPVIRTSATLFQDLFGGAGKSQGQLSQKAQFRGGTDYATKIAGDTQNYIYNLLNNNTKSLEKVHAVLDPEISKIKVDEASLTANEKEALKMVREVSDFINDTNYSLGFISKDLWQKNRGGKYLARAYEVFDYPPEVADFIKNKSIKFDLNPFKKRTEMTDWKKENAITDPAYLISKRLQQTLFNVEVKKYVDWATKSNLISDVQRPGFVQLSDSKAYGSAAGKWIRKDALEDIKGFFLTNDIGQKAYDILNWYDRNPLRRGQKMLKTVFNPAVRLGNRTGNYVFAWLNGINPVTFAKNRSWAKNAINSNDPIYRYAIQNGITGSDITKADITRISAELKRGITDKNTLQKINDWAKESYGRVDDVSKVAAFKTWLDRGVSPQEALNRTRRGFQDYNMVGMLYDLGAKIPVLGNPFVRFASESIRIAKNAAVDHPFRLAATISAWVLFKNVMSRMTGETEKDRKTREGRVGASHLPFTNISTSVMTPYGEINASRLLGFSSTFTPEDTGKLGSLGTDISKYAPFQNPLDARNYTNDPIIGPVISLATDKDFRGKSIADPKQNKYTGSLLTPGEQNLNRLGYAARSYLPPSFTDLYNIGAAIQGKENVYGQVKTPLQAILRTYPGIKIEQFGPEEAEATRQRNADYNAYELDYIQKQINAVKKQQAEGKITPQQAQKRIDSLNREKITSQSDRLRTFETSPEAPKDIMERIHLATQATITNPTNALKVVQAIFTEEKMRKLSGDTLIFEREINLNKTKEKGDAVDHIIPLSLGGDNSDRNIRYISAEANQEKAKLETSLARKLADNEITGAEARKQIKDYMNKFKADYTPSAEIDSAESNGEPIGKIYKITNKETGKETEIELTFPEYPKLTGLIEADKALKSAYYSALSKIKSNAKKLYDDGQLTAQEYNDILVKIKGSKSSSSGTTKTKSKGGKITIAKVATPTIKKFKLPTIKLPNTSLKSNIKIKKPSIAQLKKRRTIKIKV